MWQKAKLDSAQWALDNIRISLMKYSHIGFCLLILESLEVVHSRILTFCCFIGVDPRRCSGALRGDPEQFLQRWRALARRGLPPPQAIRLRGKRRPAQIRTIHKPCLEGLRGHMWPKKYSAIFLIKSADIGVKINHPNPNPSQWIWFKWMCFPEKNFLSSSLVLWTLVWPTKN